jgi:diguanylate cyclase (GGDEF)-like protein/PAS domain S-box-containing protein
MAEQGVNRASKESEQVEAELRILMIEDVPTDAELEIRELKRAGLRMAHRLVDTEAGFRDALRDFRPNLIISDFSMPQFDGMFALALARELAPDVPFIFVSGTIGEEYAIRALKNGATDYVLKNNLLRLPASVERALQEATERLALRQAQEAMRETEERFRSFMQHLPGRASIRDLKGRYTFVNEFWLRAFGLDAAAVLGRTFDEIWPSERVDDLKSTHLKVVETNKPATRVFRVGTDGKFRWWLSTHFPIPDVHGNAALVGTIAIDVTEQKIQEEKIARLSRIHAVLSGINSAIVRIRDPQQLFDEACRIAVEHGGFGIAWIGKYDAKAQEVTPAASAGLEGDYHLMGVTLKIGDDSATASGMVARAIRERRPIYSNDITLEPEVGGQRRREAIRRGYRAVCCLPLLVEGTVAGTVSLFTKEPDFFDDEEMKLLTELAGDISFALEHIAGQRKIEKLSRVRAISSEINAAIVRIRERKELLQEACHIVSQQGRFELVWIGTIDQDRKEVRPVAWTGFSAEVAQAVNWASISAAKGTLGEAMQTRRPSFRNDIEAELPGGKLRQEAVQRGCLSTVCMPVEAEGKVTALIVVFATGRGFFDQDELALLQEMASNISFALESIVRQEKIERLSRIRAVLGEMNAAIVRIRDKRQLFEEACRIAVEHGKFALSWIGTLDETAQVIKPVAKAGRDEGYLERLNLSLDPSITRHLALAVEALGRSAPVVCNDIATDGRMREWRGAALERGFRSTIMLPLLVERRAAGVFGLYSSETGFFDEDEMKLLVELAGDISFALQTIGQQEKLDYLSYYDALTSLPNRTLFHDRVNQALQAVRESGGKAALLFLDLQRFGNVNETYGRQTGDVVLKNVAERLEKVLGGRDYLARIGADTFATILRDVKHEADVAHVLEQGVLSAMALPFEIGGEELRMAAQAGIALFPGDGNDAESLFRNADAALNKAKHSGDVYLFYAPQMNARVAEQLKLENDLRNALVHEQYVLHYQPRFDLASGRIVGLEALIRWKHPERGMVSPGEFIPLLEETGMILDVGRWALRQAALEHAAWSARGWLPPRIAVNVSPAQLRRRDFVDYVKDVLAPVTRATERIDLEITESMLMEDIQGGIEKLKAVQALGMHIALDDFGTGYSSLSYLARLPINSLKIDRSFIMLMSKGPEQMAIVSTVISLARALNLKVVAEGVETEEQANLLRLLRCDEVQGYLFSRPLPPEHLEELLGKA